MGLPRFALIPDLDQAVFTMRQFTSADALAAELHALRGRRPIMTQDIAIKPDGERVARHGVSVWAIGTDDDDDGAFLGWVYIGGLGRRELAAVLDRTDPALPANVAAARVAC